MIKRYYVTTNACNTVMFSDGRHMVLLNDSGNDVSTYEKAKSIDYYALEGCKSIEELAEMISAEVYDLDYSVFETMTEF